MEHINSYLLLHECKAAKAPYKGHGPAIEICEESPEGELWVSNSEYATQVNFCPFCGYEAKKQIKEN